MHGSISMPSHRPQWHSSPTTIAEFDAYDRVCVCSFGIRRLYELRRRLGWRVPSAASALGIAANRFLPWMTWALDTPAPVLQMPISVPILGGELTVLTSGTG